jgi:hypothetical protein
VAFSACPANGVSVVGMVNMRMDLSDPQAADVANRITKATIFIYQQPSGP